MQTRSFRMAAASRVFLIFVQFSSRAAEENSELRKQGNLSRLVLLCMGYSGRLVSSQCVCEVVASGSVSCECFQLYTGHLYLYVRERDHLSYFTTQLFLYFLSKFLYFLTFPFRNCSLK